MTTNSYTGRIKEQINSLPKGSVFVAKDFANIKDAHTIRRLINLMIEQGELVRALPGIYYRPRISALIKQPVPPDPHEVAEALARSNGWTITPSGETALNRIGLSTQVSAAWTYLSDGPYREYPLNGTVLSFKRTTGRNLKGLSPQSRLLVQAIKALGKEQISDTVLDQLSKQSSAQEKQELLHETTMITEWIRTVIVNVCEESIARED